VERRLSRRRRRPARGTEGFSRRQGERGISQRDDRPDARRVVDPWQTEVPPEVSRRGKKVGLGSHNTNRSPLIAGTAIDLNRDWWRNAGRIQPVIVTARL